MTTSEIKAVADDVLAKVLAGSGFEQSYVTVGVDDAGEPSFSVVARFLPGSKALDGVRALDAVVSLRDALSEMGEEHMTMLRYDFPDDDVPALDEAEFKSDLR